MNICVYCASGDGIDAAYLELADAVGRRIAADGHALVSGGGRVSMMGAVARAARTGGAHTTGVIPQHLVDKEVAHDGVSELRVVDGMHARKADMAARADAFVALPGGAGTLEELFEVWTWAQLGLHDKPVALLDVEGYYQPLVRFVDHMVDEGFLRPEHRAMLLVEPDVTVLLDRLDAYEPPTAPVAKWS